MSIEPRSLRRTYLLLALSVFPMGILTNLAFLVGAWADRRPFEWVLAGWSMVSFACWAAIAPVVISAARRYPLRRHVMGRTILFFVLLCFVLSVCVEVLYTLARWLIKTGTAFAPSLAQEWREVFSTTSMTLNVLLFAGTVAAVWAIEAAHVSRERAQREARLEARLSETRLQLLRMQLHPHFLFNALNAVSALASSDRTAAANMLERLEEFFRFSVEGGLSQEIRLDEELKFIESYLAIEKVRFGDRLQVEFEVDPETLPLFVPSLILQPLVENAIRHGISPRLQQGSVVIRTSVVDRQLILEVDDDGVGLRMPVKEGVGIANTRNRMEHLYGRRQSLSIGPRDEAGVSVRLVIPAHEQPVLNPSARVA